MNKRGLLICFGTVVLLTVSAFEITAQRKNIEEQRITPDEIRWTKSVSNQPGSAMRSGVETVFLVGDGRTNQLYSLVFKIPPNTAIQPHSHPDERSCFVLAGLWYFAYGSVRDATKLKALPPGSSYTEPAGAAHFAGTTEQGAILECTAVGPTETTFVNSSDDPRNKK